MAERFQKIPGTQKISESYGVIDQNFERLDDELSAIEQQIESLDTLSPADRAKLDGIEEGAQVNQNAYAKVNGMEADDPSDEVTIEGGTGITVTQNPNEKKVTITATGEATPGPHGSAHLEFGSDPIPYATTTEGGLMSAEDKQKLDELDSNFAAHLAETVTKAFNVQTGFGAKGDGVTDDTAAFQACANAIAENGGGIFEIPYSEHGYVVAGTVEMPSNVFVRGNQSLIIAATPDNEQTPFFWTNKQNIVIENLRIDGRKSLKNPSISSSGGSNGITFRGSCENIIIKNLHVFDTLEHGVHFYGYVDATDPDNPFVRRSRNIHISKSTFKNNGNPNYTSPRGTGIMGLYGIRNATIEDCKFYNFVGSGVFLDSAHAGREALETAYPSLIIDDGVYCGEDTFIVRNQFFIDVDQGGNAAIAVDCQQRCEISHNKVIILVGNYTGINISDSQEESPSSHYTIEHNRVQSPRVCLTLRDSNHIRVAFNRFHQTSGNTETIQISYLNTTGRNPVHDIELSYNTIINSTGRGVRFLNQGRNLAEMYDITLDSNQIIIEDTVAANAMGIALEYVDSIDVISNRIRGGKYGIYTDGNCTNVTLQYNRIKGSERGIASGSPIRVIMNHTMGTTMHGIRLTHPEAVALFNTGPLSLSGEIGACVNLDGTALWLGYNTTGSYLHPIKFGGYYLWVDTGGKLRIKNGVPSSDTDGAVVGTQT